MRYAGSFTDLGYLGHDTIVVLKYLDTRLRDMVTPTFNGANKQQIHFLCS